MQDETRHRLPARFEEFARDCAAQDSPFYERMSMLAANNGELLWKDIDSLYNHVYRSAHAEIMNRRREWFTRMCEPSMWWCPGGNRPTIEGAIARLQILRNKGPSARAFTFTTPHPAPGQATGGLLGTLRETCNAN